MRTIGIMLFNGVEELDAVGPWEVLASWAARLAEDGWQILMFARTTGYVECAKGLVVQATHDWRKFPISMSWFSPAARWQRAALSKFVVSSQYEPAPPVCASE